MDGVDRDGLRRIGGGAGSEVFATAGGDIVRVARSAAVRRRHEREAALLVRLGPRVGGVCVPEPTLLEPSRPFPLGAFTYRALPGRPLGSAPLGEGVRARLVADLARFCRALHAVDPDRVADLGLPTLPPRDRPTMEASWRTAAAAPGPDAAVLAPIFARVVAAVAGAPSPRPVLVHGDLWHENLLVRGGRLVGVIDFEGAALGDPLVDLAVQRYVDDAFAERVAEAYGAPAAGPTARQRADLLMAVREVEGLAAGASRGDVDRDGPAKVRAAICRIRW